MPQLWKECKNKFVASCRKRNSTPPLSQLFVLLFIVTLPCFSGSSKIASISGTQPKDGVDTIASNFSPGLSFSLSKSFQNVAISLSMSAFPHSGTTATAYLTTRIGPGTTSANEVASTRFTFPTGIDYVSPDIMLFTGLTLAPNTYYVTFSNTGGANYGGLWIVFSGTAVVNPRVKVGDVVYTTSPDAYAPEASYAHQGSGLHYLPIMTITGDRVPNGKDLRKKKKAWWRFW